ncbi:dihydrolipoamide acetyltransferase family protein [Natrarchaeobaculum aegyptiacum]|uniref:Branched-chain alpha-keto acid dehydrogenase subunit E2 n=1 Tax=Natrarchaeobaculum aegyptiacum TaxID=745377 RepID=A0A2Z2HRY1_9EURY|nr:dihydrolipoamide acetyltransferase family protein [Natrarchaeobaculum aegyptiacum]ARS89900.1 branched-chain alpha-keto acid dehydrogenase subunit E2 [Natrarchaeobaculum aegyptiacum]
MVREFKLPDVGEGVAEGELVSWLVAEGDEVSEDQPVAEVETDKALVEVPSPVDGTVRELHYAEGDVIPVGEVFVTFDVAGEAEEDGDIDVDADDLGEADVESDPAGDPGATGATTETVDTPQDRIFAPPRVRQLAREEGVDLSTLEGSGPGGRLTTTDVLAATGDAPAASASTAEADPTDPDGATTTTTDAAETAADESTADSSPALSADAPSTPTDRESADRDRTLAAPATRRIAEEEGVDIDAVPAVEERDGEAFVTPEAVREYAAAQTRAQEADREAVAAGEPSGTGAAFEPGERERREPFTGVRKRIAESMVDSKYTAPHVTHHDEVDVTALVEARERLESRATDQGIRLTYLPFVTKAAVAALKEFPEMNAVIDDEADEIVYRDYYNVGIATATDAGLMVPVLEDADQKGLLQLASETNELAEKARERTISPDELRGSTFTITNIGGIGGEYATPILNYPEAGILALGRITRKPRVVTADDGTESIEPRSILPLSLSVDHRLIDGAVAARFTNELAEYLESPELLLLE